MSSASRQRCSKTSILNDRNGFVDLNVVPPALAPLSSPFLWAVVETVVQRAEAATDDTPTAFALLAVANVKKAGVLPATADALMARLGTAIATNLLMVFAIGTPTPWLPNPL